MSASNIEKVLLKEDPDSQKEKQFVSQMNLENIIDYPLVVRNLKKIYPAQEGRLAHMAVVDFSLALRKGEIFGLLGP